ncbi:FtsX-like permease family protein [Lentibacillus sp. Marseille-P4043]|uniref:FtsX-like permease family protein n=1 Tax=Lentibacillus sp. Marseille-P4043 TaxID=2040293 RepID=UPI000D0BDD80|nr:ABC transporter permease [Lentibacillus sp. Marseille-P4043]
MSINHLILQSLKKNIRNYYLYVFALVFSVALYFAFVTLQFDPAMDARANTVKGSAGIRAGAVLLIAIVAVFLLYANTLFIKRRSKEIGLFQLIGMTKGKIFRILSIENFALYVGSLAIGIFLGFAASKLIKMIFFKITDIDQVAALNFSAKAMWQTIVVFLIIYLFIMIMNFLFIRRQSVLSLFQARSKTENRVQKLSVIQILVGIFGIGLIAAGYYLSTKLFSGDISGDMLLFVMLAILGSVIIGTYLFFKGSVSFILQLIRQTKAGYLSINNVLSLSSIMFRMRSNAVLLTVITTVSALAIGLLSLTYISYYSTEKLAQQIVPNDFFITNASDAEDFMKKLDEEQIDYEQSQIDLITIRADITKALKSIPSNFNGKLTDSRMVVISDQSTEDISVSPDEAVLTGVRGILTQSISFKDKGDIALSNQENTVNVQYSELQDRFIVSSILSFGFPVAIVNDNDYQQLAKNLDPDIQGGLGSEYIGIDIVDNDQLNQANNIFQDWYDEEGNPAYSYLESVSQQKQAKGLTMFIVGFLGLTFLITSGCILYFKQMDESEEEKSTYTILRKLGFTQGDLLRGIQIKQLFNFGIPLVLGLLHSYFAVKSGWFMFGTEMLTPMVIVMLLYTFLYSIFGILSVLYYKRIIRDAL